MLRNLQVILTSLCGLFLVVSWFVPPYAPFAYVAVAAGSWFAAKSAWQSISSREIDVNLLMVFAAVCSVALGHPAEAAVLLFLFSLSNTLESITLGKTKSAIEGLMKLRPDDALLITPEGDRTVPVKSLDLGSQIRVLPFNQIPIDGILVEGETLVNEAAMTGESQPVAKAPGDKLLAGTQNTEGMIIVEATTVPGDTTLEKIVALVEQAQEHKASGERISLWFGKRYTFFVLGAFGLSLVIRFLLGSPIQEALYSSLTLLVALSPCALVISSPATSLSALAWAARNGILIRGGQFVELAGKVDTIALDKTGTLTKGVFELAEICVCQETLEMVGGSQKVCREEENCWHQGGTLGETAASILRVAASAEQYSTHPIAEAIVLAARHLKMDVPEATDLQVSPGLGVSCTVGGDRVVIGQRKLFEQTDQIPAGFDAHALEMESRGMTVAIILYRSNYAALGLRDEPRAEAKDFVSQVRAMGIKSVVMLTGDTEQTAKSVAKEVGLDDIHASLLPAAKDEIISRLIVENDCVMMVGDGINDAPSLARAHVGVAMGGLGSDIALNAADIVLMQDRLARIPEVIKLGRLTNRVIRANLIFAAAVITCLTIGSIIGNQYPPIRGLLFPFAVVGHEGSTVLVILNGLRLLRGPGS